ncbi:MAG: hypothetical protein O9325_07050 [Roseomonas sp.]|nr:hypothetical protein [Roseomonas sp.]
MTNNIQGASEDIAEDLAALRQDVARLSESIAALLQSQSQGAAQRVTDAVEDARAKLAGTAADVKSLANAAGADIEASVARNPLTAMLISFGLGMALGMMSRSRH